jgi:hypothetical protein
VPSREQAAEVAQPVQRTTDRIETLARFGLLVVEQLALLSHVQILRRRSSGIPMVHA